MCSVDAGIDSTTGEKNPTVRHFQLRGEQIPFLDHTVWEEAFSLLLFVACELLNQSRSIPRLPDYQNSAGSILVRPFKILKTSMRSLLPCRSSNVITPSFLLLPHSDPSDREQERLPCFGHVPAALPLPMTPVVLLTYLIPYYGMLCRINYHSPNVVWPVGCITHRMPVCRYNWSSAGFLRFLLTPCILPYERESKSRGHRRSKIRCLLSVATVWILVTSIKYGVDAKDAPCQLDH